VSGRTITFDQGKDWDEIIRLEREGYDAIDKWHADRENSELWDRRMQIFKDAATKLDAYIKAYVKDLNSPTYLRTKYRLGMFLELSRQLEAARDAYTVCQDHPRLREVIFDNKPLEAQVTDRLKQVKFNLGKQYSRKPGYIYVHRGGGHAIFEELDFEFLPEKPKDPAP